MELSASTIRVLARAVYNKAITENRTYEDILTEYPKISDDDKTRIIAWINDALVQGILSEKV